MPAKVLTDEKLSSFLTALAETGSVTRACKAISISRETAYTWREDNPEFAKNWEIAKERSLDMLEDEAVRRATKGTKEPVFHQGEVCGTVKKYSDTLLIFLLKGGRPEKYRDNVNMTGNFAGKFTIVTGVEPGIAGDGDEVG